MENDMELRCKVGEMVILTARNMSDFSNFGLVGQIHKTGRIIYDGEPFWTFVPELYNSAGWPMMWSDDACDPIRDQPGADETLAWAPVPGRVVEMVL